MEALKGFVNHFNVIVMGPPPLFSILQYAQCRNDDMIYLYSQKFAKLCAEHGLRYLDVFSIVYPRFNETMKNDHYLYCKKHKCTGDVGKIVTQVAIKELECNGM